MPTEDCVQQVIEAMVAVIREELPPLVRSGRNWKFIFNGSAGGDVRTAAELHTEVLRRYRALIEQIQE
jgi:hypothetical protein